MPNRRLDPVSYRPFQVDPLLSEGLLDVPRDGGDLERKVAAGLARVAEEYRLKADKEAAARGIAAADVAGREGRPGGVTITGGTAGTASINGQAGHVRGAQGGIRVQAGKGNESAAYARDYLKRKHGFSDVAAAAVAGHGMQESAFNLDAIGDSGTAYGAFQWRGDRLANLKRFAAANGGDWKKLDTQLDFAVHELGTSERTAGQALSAATTLDDAVAAFMHFERPQGYTAQNPRGGHGFANRLAFARGLAGKAGGATYSALPDAAAVAPVSVVPVEEEATVQYGKPGGFRPTGKKDAYSRAYDVQGTKTYLEELKFTMLQDQQAVYDKFKDDPAMLEKTFGELETAHMRDHVFPEIEAEYSLDFRKSAYLYVQQAKGEQEKRDGEANRMAALDRAGILENEKSRALAGFDPNDPGAATRLADIQASIDGHYDSAVARGVLSEREARQAKEKSRSDLTVDFYAQQSAGKLPADIAKMREEFRSDYADGLLPGVSADQFDAITERLEAQERAAETRGNQADKALEVRGKDIAERVRRGLPVDSGEIARLELDRGTAPNGDAIVRSTLMKLGVSEAIRTLPIGKVEDELWSILAKNGDVTPEEYDYATKQVSAHKAEVANDPLGVAERLGILPRQENLPDPAAASADEMAGALNARIIAANAAADHFGVRSKIFRPEEEAAIKRSITSTNVEQHGAAMQELDVLAGALGLQEVGRLFGKDGMDRLQDWQARVRYATPEEAKQWLRDRNDPAWVERSKPRIAAGEKAARAMSEAAVIDLLDENRWYDVSGPADGATRGAMMADFARLTGERMAVTGDAEVAKQQAIERMRKVWGVTSAFGERGGRLMLYPPEEHYPSVDGSTDWIGNDLATVAQERGYERESLSLVSDGKTKAAIERGEQPGYLLSRIDPKTGLESLVTDDMGRPLRQFFDPQAALARAKAEAIDARKTRKSPLRSSDHEMRERGGLIGGLLGAAVTATADALDDARPDPVPDPERDLRLDEKRRRREILRRDGLPEEQ